MTVVVDRLEVQQDPPAQPIGRNLDRAAIPHDVHEIHVPDPRERRLGAERHGNRAAELPFEQAAVQPAVPMVDLELPRPVQAQPVVAHELRTRVLRARNGHQLSFLELTKLAIVSINASPPRANMLPWSAPGITKSSLGQWATS